VTTHGWKVGDEVWCAFIRDMRYAPRLIGRVSGVGRDGFTVKLLKRNHAGELTQRIPFDSSMTWRVEAEARAWCAEKVGPYGPGEGKDELRQR
jgi:hypothetical protein